MQTRLTLKPGDRGTRKLQAYYGDRLVCVRYRYDPETQRRIKTAEIIVDEATWPLPPNFSNSEEDVLLEVDYSERDLRERIKAAGGHWHPDNKA